MHTHIFTENQKSVLELLSQLEIVSGFYLAGGTALALHFGHRQSLDFDFFKEQPFVIDAVLNKLNQMAETDVRVKEENTLLILIEGISCSFFRYPYPLLREKFDFRKNVKLASTADIAAMKISAISTRGTKRDFVDLFFICEKEYSLQEVLKFYQEKFKVWNHDLYHVYKSLMYFGDAEDDAMPVMYVETNWNTIKNFFENQAKELMRSN